MSKDLHAVYVQYGLTGTYWDASFSPDQCEAVDVDPDTVRMISVEVEPDGSVSLNAAHDPESDQYDAERRLFDNYIEGIEAALLINVRRIADQGYEAFIARMDGARPTPH